MLTKSLGCNISAAGQFDLSRNANDYSGGTLVSSMEPFNALNIGSKNAIRPIGTAGIFYDINNKERLSVNANAGEQAFTTRGYASVLAGYTIGF